MHSQSQKFFLFILGLTALSFSRLLFFFFNDPEGPNLLIVFGMAAILYFLSLSAYLLNLSAKKKAALAILIQLIAVLLFYIFLH